MEIEGPMSSPRLWYLDKLLWKNNSRFPWQRTEGDWWSLVADSKQLKMNHFPGHFRLNPVSAKPQQQKRAQPHIPTFSCKFRMKFHKTWEQISLRPQLSRLPTPMVLTQEIRYNSHALSLPVQLLMRSL
jgi:hypothetical protein